MKLTYTHEEACVFLNVSASSLDDLIATGTLPAAKISKCWVIRAEDLESYLAEQVRIQTQQRRDGFRTGIVAKVPTARATVRAKRKEHPALPELAKAA